ncbi:hypothetical protein K0651_01875 [Ornithinimicrobium sp. Arc0846-15]|nr:hypothetical protein [Ornithinimicrobium laminariae]
MPEIPDLVAAPQTTKPGAPTAEQIASTSAAIRVICGWHIAPSIEQTITIDADGGSTLDLPSMHVTAVTSVMDLSGPTPVEITDYRWSKAGMLQRPGGWPRGFQTVEVTMTHGLTASPDSIAALVTTIATRRVTRESIGGRSLELDSVEQVLAEQALAAYRIGSPP